MSQSANLASFSIYGSRYPGGSVVATMAEPNILRLDGGSTGSEANPTLILQINKNLSIPESNKFYLGAYTFSISTRITNQESSSFGGFRSVSLYKGSPSDMDSAVLQNAITSQFLTQTSGTHTISFTIRNHIDGPFFLVIVLRSNSTFYYDDYTVSVTFEKESYQGTVELTNGTDGNLLPLFTGNPSWYSENGYYRTDRDLVISTNSDGSISLEGIADTEDCYKLFVPLDASDGALLGAGTTTSDLYLDTGTYEFGYVTDGDDSSYSKIEVDIYGINGLNRGRIGGASSKSSALVRIGETATELQPGPDYYYLVVDPKTTDFSTKLTFKPYLYRQGEKPEELSLPVADSEFVPWDNTGNLFPQFSGYPDWYIVGGSSSASLWDIEVQSDGSFLLNGTPRGTYFVNYQILKKGDLILAPGNYQYKIKFDGVVEFSSSDPQIFFELISVEDDHFGSDVAPRIELSAIEHEVIYNFSVYSSVNVAFRFFTHGAVNIENLRFKPYVYRVGPTGNDEQAPVITVHPQSITVLTGNTATFSVTASGSNLSYSWEVSTDNGATWTSLGWTTSSISFTAALSQNGYRYHCVVTENGNSTTSNLATLTVTSSSGGNDNPTNPSNPSAPGTSTNTHTELSELFTGTQSYTFPEDYFSSGRIYWRVRSYDSDGKPGEWSESVSFICYGVSKVSYLVCDEKPFATISWGANGQVSYEIRIDDNLRYGPYHGTDGRFVLPEPLADGTHTVGIRVWNNLGLESPWSEITINVQNEPLDDTSTSLVINQGIDAALWWAPLSIRSNDQFLVYRDNKLIKVFDSSVTSFTDRTVLGRHKYDVIQRLPSGYYNLFTHPPVFLETDTTKIALYEGGAWFDLSLTTDRYPTNTFKRTRITEKTRIMGSKYPVVEVSDFEELSAQYEAYWPYEDRENAYRFRDMIGKAVIVKSRGEQVVIGVLDAYELPVNSQTIGYSFTVEQMSLDDDVHDTGDIQMADLDKIEFGQMTSIELAMETTNPGTSDPKNYEGIAEAINELKKYLISKPKENNDVTFYDYDGTIVYSYSVEEFLELTEMPDDPKHPGLISQGWNWSLNGAQEYARKYGKINIGQTYITDDGRTRIYVRLLGGRLSPSVSFCLNGVATVDWGDGSENDTAIGEMVPNRYGYAGYLAPEFVTLEHTYDAPGDYVISIAAAGELYFVSTSAYPNHSSATDFVASCIVWNQEGRNEDRSIIPTEPTEISSVWGRYDPIEADNFYRCTVQKIELGNNVFFDDVSYIDFDNCFNNLLSLKTITIPKGLQILPWYCFYYCSSLKCIVIPEGAQLIRPTSFFECHSLQLAILPESIREISHSVFGYCYTLDNITFSENLVTIGENAFGNCQHLGSLVIPESVKRIERYAFFRCLSVASVDLAGSDLSIEVGAFGEPYGLGKLKFRSVNPPRVESMTVWAYLSTACKIYVPRGSLDAYTHAPNYPSPEQYTYIEY